MRNLALQTLSSLFIVASLLAACSTEDRTYGANGAGSGVGGAGGSGSGTGGASSGVGGAGGAGGGIDTSTPEGACKAFAYASCQKQAECAPWTQTATYGAFDVCIDRFQLFCEASLAATDTGRTVTFVNDCAKAYAMTPCDLYPALFFGGSPPACKSPAGARADGAACMDDAQCMSTNCQKSGGLCGACAPVGAAGSPCMSRSDCEEPLTCLSGVCTPTAALGESCVPGQIPCRYHFVCDNGTCVQPFKAGDACTPGAGQCNGFIGLYCDMGLGVCQAKLLANEGEACGQTGSGITDCAASGNCLMGSPPTCIAAAADGAICAPGNGGPGCTPPAQCIGGTCVTPNPTGCDAP